MAGVVRKQSGNRNTSSDRAKLLWTPLTSPTGLIVDTHKNSSTFVMRFMAFDCKRDIAGLSKTPTSLRVLQLPVLHSMFVGWRSA